MGGNTALKSVYLRCGLIYDQLGPKGFGSSAFNTIIRTLSTLPNLPLTLSIEVIIKLPRLIDLQYTSDTQDEIAASDIAWEELNRVIENLRSVKKAELRILFDRASGMDDAPWKCSLQEIQGEILCQLEKTDWHQRGIMDLRLQNQACELYRP